MAMGVAVAADLVWHLASGVAGLLLVVAVWVFYFVWWTPRQLERALRAQGLDGTPYRFPHGDRELSARLDREVHAKPMTFSHSIIPRVAPFTHRTVSQYGKISFTWAGLVPEVTITDVGLVRQLLLNMSHDFEKPKLNPLAKFFFRGVFTYEGEKWAKHRRILNPAFHMEKLKVLDSSMFLPAERKKRIKALDREIRELLGSIIKKREEDIKNVKASNGNLLGLLLESTMTDSQEHGNNNAGMTIEEVIEECKLFYFAGQETSAVLLTWTMILLSMHPEWQVRAREEVLRVFGENKPDFDGLSRLKTVSNIIILPSSAKNQLIGSHALLDQVTMILHEVLRLYPPITFIQRHTYKTIKLGDVNYPPGVLLRLPILFFNHDPEIWGEDASEFNPERFAEGVSNACKNHQLVFFPFGGGPRNCIGQNFALMEAKMALAAILQHFSFELSPAYAHAPLIVLSLVPQHGAHLRLRRF
ncbi:hypothetical protein B296_00023917 [Ensete ventricosum]|uniref:Cytochrome P450 n=1 Tax=Ensete ventricosum TaxID=4639 RepID=A0A427A3W0_ENSVE|nr:hypothetical protein B296_00023917 [Ensete ventricosum]